MKNALKELAFVLIILILSFGALRPLFVPGFFPMHDDTQPARVYEMAQALAFGQFPVRWVSDLGYGYGYPLFNFYAPLPYYVGAFFNLRGTDAITATKIMFGIGIILSALSMYFLGKELSGTLAGVAVSMLYLYAPYHAVNIYVRGAVGEYYAYGFLPLLLLGILKIIKSPRLLKKNRPLNNLQSDPDQLKKGLLLSSLGFSGLLLSHNILGFITTFFLIIGLFLYLIYTLLKRVRLRTFLVLLFCLSVGFGIAAFFTVPAVAENKFTRVDELITGGSDFHQHFVYLDQLWDSPWGYGGSAPGRADGMSFKIGKVQLLLGFAAIIYLFYLHIFRPKDGPNRSLSIIILISSTVFIVSIFLMLEQSKVIWEILPGFSYIQYPWRFLNFTLISLTILTSFLFIAQKRIIQILLAVTIIGLTLWINIKYFVPQLYLSSQDKDYVSKFNLSYKISKISDEYLPHGFLIPRGPNEIVFHGMENAPNIASPEIIVNKIIKETPTEKSYSIIARKKSNTVTNLTFFPGWQAFLDGSKIPIGSSKGRITVLIFPGQHSLEFRLTNTFIQSFSNTVSLFSLFLLVYVTILVGKNRLWQKDIR